MVPAPVEAPQWRSWAEGKEGGRAGCLALRHRKDGQASGSGVTLLSVPREGSFSAGRRQGGSAHRKNPPAQNLPRQVPSPVSDLK